VREQASKGVSEEASKGGNDDTDVLYSSPSPTPLLTSSLTPSPTPLLPSSLTPSPTPSLPSSLTHSTVESLLNLKICDPACGSGHFLIGAAHRLAKQIADIRCGNDEPSPLEIQHALREVVSRCIYGVDINPLAVELCKISLWMDAMEPGKPLAFLDHHIQCGNSLIGATPELLQQGIPDEAFDVIEGDDKKFAAMYKKRNKEHRTRMEEHRQDDLSDEKSDAWEKGGNLPQLFRYLATMKDEKEKEDSYYKLINSVKYSDLRRFPDAWCAAFVWIKHPDAFDYPITELEFRRIEKNPHNCPPWMKTEILRLAEQYQFFHWYLAFPDVFGVSEVEGVSEEGSKGVSGRVSEGVSEEGSKEGNEDTETLYSSHSPTPSLTNSLKNSGFDVILGNPPWERVKLQEKEWFADRNKEIANAPNAAARKMKIDELKQKEPALATAFSDALRKAEGESKFIRQSGRYPLCGRGDVNTYTIFAELNRQLLSRKGRVGCIVPSGIATDDTTKFFFQDLMDKQTLVSLFDFENRKAIFPGVHRSYKFSLLTMCSPENPIYDGAELAFFALDTKDLDEEDKIFRLTPQEIAMINPNTRTCPIFRSVKDAELTKAIYRRVPVLINETNEITGNPWGITFSRMFDMSNDSHLFRTKKDLESQGLTLIGNHFVRKTERFLPLYEAKMIHQFNHRFGDYADLPTDSKSTQLPNIPPERLNNPKYMPLPRYWVTENEVKQRIPDGTKYLIGFRSITNTTNERAVISSVIPITASGNSFILFFSRLLERLFVVSDMSSFIHDYTARQKISGTNLNFFIFNQIPALPPSAYNQLILTRLLPHSQTHSLTPYILELTYTSNDLRDFAQDCGDNGEPFRWNEERRFLLRCELDALFFGLYLGFGDWSLATEYEETPEQHAKLTQHFPTPLDAIDYIMETFPIVKRKDIAKYDGIYCTKETILSIYKEMTAAIQTNTPYQTRLNPPPADDSIRHGSKVDSNLVQYSLQKLKELAALERIRQLSPISKKYCSLFLKLVENNPNLTTADHSLMWVIGKNPSQCEPLLDKTQKRRYSKILKPKLSENSSISWKDLFYLLKDANCITVDRVTDNQLRMASGVNFDKEYNNLRLDTNQYCLFSKEILDKIEQISKTNRSDQYPLEIEIISIMNRSAELERRDLYPTTGISL
jgi:methylase of polypeptide subunit release factors